LFGVHLTGAALPVAATDGVQVELEGVSIPRTDAAKYHCHDRDYPVVRCFRTPQARDRDGATAEPLGLDAKLATSVQATSSLFYVTFYEHANYLGASFTTSAQIGDLGVLGWNDRISSFKSLSGQRPKWWQDNNYLGTSWQWAAGAHVANVGDGANDRFSSVKNVP